MLKLRAAGSICVASIAPVLHSERAKGPACEQICLGYSGPRLSTVHVASSVQQLTTLQTTLQALCKLLYNLRTVIYATECGRNVSPKLQRTCSFKDTCHVPIVLMILVYERSTPPFASAQAAELNTVSTVSHAVFWRWFGLPRYAADLVLEFWAASGQVGRRPGRPGDS